MTEVAQALRDKTAVCGAGLLLGDFPDRTALSLAVDAYQLALDDAGLKREDVDGIIQLSFGYDYDRFLEAVGTGALCLSGLEPRAFCRADAAACRSCSCDRDGQGGGDRARPPPQGLWPDRRS